MQQFADASMDVYDIIMAMLHYGGGARGRAAIQKLAYLAKWLHPEFDVPEYKSHYYGQFSAEVEKALADLVSYSFVDEKRRVGPEYRGYQYELTGDGEKAVEKIKERHPAQCDILRRLVEKCKKTCGLSAHSLSFAAKIHFAQAGQPHERARMSDQDLKTYGADLGWGIADKDLSGGIKLLVELKIGTPRQRRPRKPARVFANIAGS